MREDDIQQEFRQFFMKLFSSGGPIAWSDVLGNVDCVVTEEMNALLLAPVKEGNDQIKVLNRTHIALIPKVLDPVLPK